VEEQTESGQGEHGEEERHAGGGGDGEGDGDENIEEALSGQYRWGRS
jgi:hypothetical protein